MLQCVRFQPKSVAKLARMTGRFVPGMRPSRVLLVQWYYTPADNDLLQRLTLPLLPAAIG